MRPTSEGGDWMLTFQSRNWVEKQLRNGYHESMFGDPDAPSWKVSGQAFLETLRDMILENGESKLSSDIKIRRDAERGISRFLEVC